MLRVLGHIRNGLDDEYAEISVWWLCLDKDSDLHLERTLDVLVTWV